MTTSAEQLRGFTPARIVTLALVAVVTAGLVVLKIGSSPDRVSVPAGAKAGDLALHRCIYATEDGGYPADCGTLVVPENRARRGPRLIALPVTRIRARTAHPGEPLFRLDGGPGMTNMAFANASRLAGDRDVVLVGYRGVDGSLVLDCPEVSSALARSTDRLSEASFRAFADGLRSCARRLTGSGVDLAGYSLTQQVEDMEAARAALGYNTIDLLSESAGTRTAMIYARRHPERIHRSVMIGVNPPGHYLWDPAITDRQFRRYAELCAADASCRRRTGDLVASLRKTGAHLPGQWGPLPIKPSNVRIGSFIGLFETSPSMAPLIGTMTLDTWLSAAEGDPSGMWFLSLLGDLVYPYMFIWGEFAAIGVQDAAVARAYFSAGGDPGSVLGNPTTAFLWGGGQLAAAWPANTDDAQYGQVRPSAVETLLISGELDFTTPPEVAARELLPSLLNGYQVVVPGLGHAGSFYGEQPEAGSRLINTFLSTGRVEDSIYRPVAVDFTPGSRHATMAKVIASVLVGLSLLSVKTLLGMIYRVRRRGRFGPVAAALARSVVAAVVGVGGWCLGVLAILITLPRVSLDNQLLAVLAVGLPVTGCLHLAWVHRDWPAGARIRGLAAASAGTLAGAWLGFHATAGLFALVTAVASAVAGGNLALLVLDLREPAHGDPVAISATRS